MIELNLKTGGTIKLHPDDITTIQQIHSGSIVTAIVDGIHKSFTVYEVPTRIKRLLSDV